MTAPIHFLTHLGLTAPVGRPRLQQTRTGLGQTPTSTQPGDTLDLSISSPKAQQPTTPTVALSLASLKSQPNPLESERLVDLVADWTRYGGSLYNELTGKTPRLQPGHDYSVGPKGEIDLASYQAARDQQLGSWEATPGFRTWQADFETLVAENRHQISYGAKRVGMMVDGRLVEKERHTAPSIRENDWFCHESNYCDTTTGTMTQPDREENAYRVYLSVKEENVVSTFRSMIERFSQDPELQRLGFQAKMPDMENAEPATKARTMNQKDRIVLYLGEKGVDRALPILQQMAEEDPQRFDQPGVLFAQPVPTKDGRSMSGMRLAEQVKGLEKARSFNELHGDLLGDCLDGLALAFRQPKTLASLEKRHPELARGLAELPSKADTRAVMATVVSTPEGRKFLARQLEENYPGWAGRRGLRETNLAFRDRS